MTFFTFSGDNCIGFKEDVCECILYTLTILTKHLKLNIFCDLSIMLRNVNMEIVSGINYTNIPRVIPKAPSGGGGQWWCSCQHMRS